MSGAVQSVAKAASKVIDVVSGPEQAIHRSIMGTDFVKNDKLLSSLSSHAFVDPAGRGIKALGDGKGASGAIGASAGRTIKDVKGSAGAIAGTLNPQEAPATIVAEDPAAVQAEAEKKKARAKRQAEIDILTDRPGRGGTVLTDQYTYNV